MMQPQDLRTWLVLDPNFTPGYVPPQSDAPRRFDAPAARMPLFAVENLLASAAFAGSSAFVDICFDLDSPEH